MEKGEFSGQSIEYEEHEEQYNNYEDSEVEKSSGEESNNDSDKDSDEEDPNNEGNYEEYNLEEVISDICVCKTITDKESALNLLLKSAEDDYGVDTADCILDNVVRALNYIFKNDFETSSVYKIAAVDLFYRFRHEFLFKLFCKAYNLGVTKTDVSFRNFGIESDRTPDLIMQVDKTLFVIEISAVSSLEKGAVSKGIEDLGFESKYRKELDMLDELGVNNKYVPVVFDMSDPNNCIDPELLREMDNNFIRSNSFYLFMKSKSKYISIISNDFKKHMIFPSSQLFANHIPITQKHQNHKFLYEMSENSCITHQYEEMIISPLIYNKINNNWGRLLSFVERKDFTDNTKICFVVNTRDHKISVEKMKDGALISLIYEIVTKNDKKRIFEFVKIKTGDIIYPSTNSDNGVKFYNKSKLEIRSRNNNFNEITTLTNHSGQPYLMQLFNFEKYQPLVNNIESIFMNSMFYDENYEDKLLESIKGFDNLGEDGLKQFPKLIGNLDSCNIEIDSVMDKIGEEYLNVNSKNDYLPIKNLKMKSPFILPLANFSSDNYTSLNFKNRNFIERIMEGLGDNNDYTVAVLNGTLKEKYKMFENPRLASATLHKLYDERMTISSDINKLQKEVYKATGNSLKLSKISDPGIKDSYLKLSNKYKQVIKNIKNREGVENVKRDISFVRLPSKGNSLMALNYKKEMDHFNRSEERQSTIEGVGIRNSINDDYNKDKIVFNNVCRALTEYKGANPDLFIDEYVSEDVSLLKDLKRIAVSEYKNIIDSVRSSLLGHAAAFISRMSHSLLFYSQLAFNSDYIRVDNLGYKNCLLIVKGGKKIFKSKSSKLFRLVYPVLEEAVPWYNEGHSNLGSNKLIWIDGLRYLITPWIMLHESILTDSISFYPRISSFCVLNLNPKISFSEQFSKVSMNILLAFHNRRQTEVLLANMRYILLSTLGDFTGVEDILPEFFGFNYDCFQSFIRTSILINYPTYFKKIQKLKDSKVGSDTIKLKDFKSLSLQNIFTNNYINTTEDLTLMIYSTFLMTKAPYQRPIERANNLKGILKIHEEYDGKIGLNLSPQNQLEKITVTCGGDYSDYINDLFENDFKIDPKYLSCLGLFINSEFESRNLKEHLFNTWYRILSSTWDEMSTSTGLRGDYDEVEDFWGKKGYFVVYKQLLKNRDFTEGMMKLFVSDKKDDEKRKILRKLNIIYLDKLEDPREFLIFHAVDKVQWRGSREIYVMDIMTKTMQQPIERYMGEICKLMDNELISVPSDKRSQVIHHSIFEKDLPLKETLTWYLTLDCSKWAPKSIFVKFIIMFLSMEILPNTFKIHFLNYMEKLFYKRIYFNNKEVEVLMNNSRYTEVCDKYLVKDNKVDGYYLLMPYSWVMGIFNYTSSFLHAANQKYCSYLLMSTSISNYQEETSLFMFAHSDDSGGRLMTSNKFLARRALIIYEVNLKSCNHLLSKKKSVISRIYFEILSIIYLFKQLMALLPKFLGGVRFLPTDKGPCQDMSQAYSKCIEVMINGANFNISYIVLKMYAMMIWRFYYNEEPTALDYKRPVQYMGIPDAHPIMILLCGSDSDLIRLLYQGADLSKLLALAQRVMKTNDEGGPIKPLKFEIKVKGIKKGFENHIEQFEDILDKWSIRNVNYHSSTMNTLQFLNKLRDSGFVGSLVNESTTRRFSRSYYIRSGYSVPTNYGNLKLKTVLDVFRVFQSYNSNDDVKNVFGHLFSEEHIKEIDSDIEHTVGISQKSIDILLETLQSPLKICKYLDQLNMNNRKINFHPRTLKPTVVQLVKSVNVFSTKFDPASLVSYVKEPEMRWALNDTKGLITSRLELETLLIKKGKKLEEVQPDALLKMCRDFGPLSHKTIYLYSRVPSELRQIKSYSAFLTFISVNTFDEHEISGLTLKLSNKDVSKEYLPLNINEDIYVINNIITIINILFCKFDYNFFIKIKLKPNPDIFWLGGNVTEFIDHIENSFDDDVHLAYFIPQISYLRKTVENKYTGAEILNKGAFYTFLKSQRVRGNWYGSGELYIRFINQYFSLKLYNNKITNVSSNCSGKILQHVSDFIRDVCENNGVEIGNLPILKQSERNIKNKYFGYDYSGQLTVAVGREVISGVMCEPSDYRNSFVEQLYMYQLDGMHKDHITLRCDIGPSPVYKKIYFLPIKKVEIMAILPQILYKNDFDDKLAEIGLNDFEEFVLTEILTEYGGENYIDFETLIDNYPGSKLFEILNRCEKEDLSYIPKRPKFSNFPASEGSLTKILIDYTLKSKEPILSIPTNLSTTMMQIRSEYPEQMGVILSEKLVEYHKSIFSKNEQREISDSYHKMTTSEDPDIVRSHLIKLMTYWGYGSLVNSIQTFSLVRSPESFIYFNISLSETESRIQYSDLFVFFTDTLCDTMKEWSTQYRGLNSSRTALKNNCGMDSVLSNYIRAICLELYGFTNLDLRPNLNVMEFHDTFNELLKDEDFCSALQLNLSKNYIMGCIPISFKHRRDILILNNVLRYIWSENNKIDFKLKFNTKMQRLPLNIPNWKSVSRQFKMGINPSWAYYNGGISEKVFSAILRKDMAEIKIKNRQYRITTKISELSNVSVTVNETIKFKRPLKNSVLNHEMWEELIYELETDSPYQETVDECLEELGELYKSKITKVMEFKERTVVRATIHWIIEPAFSCKSAPLNYLRQVGENIVLLTNCQNPYFLNNFSNSKYRTIEYSRGEKLFCYISFQNELNNEAFIDQYIGKNKLNIEESYKNDLCTGLVRNWQGQPCKSNSLGVKIDENIMRGNKRFITKDNITIIEDNNEQEPEICLSAEQTELENKKIMLTKIRELSGIGLSKQVIKKLEEKYIGLITDYRLKIGLLVDSLIKEADLNKINEDLKNENLKLNSNEYKGSFLSPECFGVSYGLNVIDNKSIRNKNVRAEIEAFDETLSSKVGSGFLYLSYGFKKIVDAQLKMWKVFLKNTKTKKENKNFLITILLTLLSCSKVGEDDCDDSIWQNIINKTTMYMVQEEDESEDEEDFVTGMQNIIPFSRIRYRPKGT